MNDDISIELPGVTITGWTGVRVTRGIERCPSDFEIEITERFPGEFSTLTVVPGQACTVKAGTDVLVTGYIDRYIPSISGKSHSIAIVGRGKCQDLVDCAASWPGGQIPTSNAFNIASKLAEPFDIAVNQQSGLNSDVQQLGLFNLILGETAWEIIERVCRNAGVLCYETSDGNLMLSQVGTASAASGFEEGVNIENASYILSMDERYSQYTAFRMSFDSFQVLGNGNFLKQINDQGVTRYRPHITVAEGGPGNFELAIRKAIWEKNRRIGRSYQLQLVTDGWRDKDGQLYTPNTLANVNIPTLKIANQDWVIGEVTFRLDEEHGHIAEIIMMPPGAFLPEPELIGPAFSFGPPA